MKTFASITVSAMALLLAAGATPAQAEGFSGFYAGLQLGDTFGDSSSYQNVTTGGAFSAAADYKFSALSGGAHVGYTHQFDKFVIGAAFSIDLLDAKTSDNQTTTDVAGTDLSRDHNTLAFDTIYSLDAKGGWQALPGTLLYATGGWAWASADASVDYNVEDVTGPTTGTVSTSEGRSLTLSGFTYGLGADFQMTDNTTIGIQWRHYSLDNNEVTFVKTGNNYQLGFEPDLDTVQIKASYFFLPPLNF